MIYRDAIHRSPSRPIRTRRSFWSWLVQESVPLTEAEAQELLAQRSRWYARHRPR